MIEECYGTDEFFTDLINLFQNAIITIFNEWKGQIHKLIKDLKMIKPKRSFSSDEVTIKEGLAKFKNEE